LIMINDGFWAVNREDMPEIGQFCRFAFLDLRPDWAKCGARRAVNEMRTTLLGSYARQGQP